MHETVATVNDHDKTIKSLVKILTTKCPLVDGGLLVIHRLTEIAFSLTSADYFASKVCMKKVIKI